MDDNTKDALREDFVRTCKDDATGTRYGFEETTLIALSRIYVVLREILQEQQRFINK